MATRVIYLTPEEVRAAVVRKAEGEITERAGDLVDVRCEFSTTADGTVAIVTFADAAVRPASLLPKFDRVR